MGTDYSFTIFGDLTSWMDGGRKCVFCRTKGDLSRVAVSAYSGHDWYYFHEKCLQKVKDNPERYEMFVDLANEIETEIDRYAQVQKRAKLRRELEEALTK